MTWVFILGALFILATFNGCTKEKIVYKCPEGQVKVLENAGTTEEVERCYTPGVSYTDYRPLTAEAEK